MKKVRNKKQKRLKKPYAAKSMMIVAATAFCLAAPEAHAASSKNTGNKTTSTYSTYSNESSYRNNAGASTSGSNFSLFKPVNPREDWRGPYIGAHGGGMWSEFNNRGGAFDARGDDGSFAGGVQIGHNWQVDRFVFGPEADVTWMDLQSRNGPARYSQDWQSTVRGRAGFAFFDNLMAYGTGGVAFTNNEIAAGGATDEETAIGPAYGGGLDMLLNPNWVTRVEYLRTEAPIRSHSVSGIPVSGGSDNDQVRFGVNYKF